MPWETVPVSSVPVVIDEGTVLGRVKAGSLFLKPSPDLHFQRECVVQSYNYCSSFSPPVQSLVLTVW